MPLARILSLPGADPWGLDLKSLQIISLIRSAFDGNVTFVFSHTSLKLVPSARILGLPGAPPPGPLGVTSQYPLHC